MTKKTNSSKMAEKNITALKRHNQCENEFDKAYFPLFKPLAKVVNAGKLDESDGMSMLLYGTYLKVRLVAQREKLYMNYMNCMFEEILGIFDSLSDEIDSVKMHSVKMQDIARRIKAIRHEQAKLHQKFDKIEPTVNGIELMIQSKMQQMEKVYQREINNQK